MKLKKRPLKTSHGDYLVHGSYISKCYEGGWAVTNLPSLFITTLMRADYRTLVDAVKACCCNVPKWEAEYFG